MESLEHKFNIIIVGAGIAGLCAAVGLAQQGHTVTILEAAHELKPIGVGLHVPPNATAVLKHFGILNRLEKDALLPTSFIFRRWEDSSVIAKFPASRSDQDNATPYWSIRRSHYQKALYEAAIEYGAKLRLNATVRSMDLDAPSVTLKDGEVLGSDLIVLADGIKSNLRQLLFPNEDVSLALTPMSAYRAYVYGKDLEADPVTAPLFKEPATNVWMGYNHHSIIYPCGGDLYTVGATHPASAEQVEPMKSLPATAEQAVEEFGDFDKTLRAILSHGQEVKKWRIGEVSRLSRWVSKSGKVVLMGDSAHASVQYMAQGAAMATEDAGALAECISRAKSANDIPGVLCAFERSRKWRCEIIQANSRRSGDVIHMPDGEEQENRDKQMAGLPQTGIWRADAGPFMDQDFRTFLYGHNAIEHTRKVLSEMGFGAD